MATSGEANDAFSGRSRFNLRIAIALDSISGNSSRWDYSLRVENLDKSTLTWDGGTYPYTVVINGTTVASGQTPVNAFDFRDGDSYHNIKLGTTGWIPHNSDGYKTISIKGTVSNAGLFGSASASGSVVANRIPKPPGPPPAPVFVSATDSSLTFTIAQPSDNGGSTVTSYLMQVLEDSGGSPGAGVGNWQSGASSQTTPSSLNLESNTYYWVYYRAINAIGSGQWSPLVRMKTAPGVPQKPGTPTLSFDAPTTLNASWSAAPSDLTILEYQVQRSTDSTFGSGVTTASAGTSRTLALTGLTIDSTWYVRVRARNSAGWGAWSAAGSYRIPGLPTATRPTLSFDAPSTLNASWAAADGDGQPILEYQIRWDDNSSFSSASSASTGTSRTRALTSLAINKTWYAQTRARTSQGWSPWSSTASYAIPNVPGTVGTPTVSNPTTTSVDVAWSAPGNGGASITGYNVQWNTSQSATGATTQGQGTSTTKTVGGLTPGQTYFVRVQAVNSQGTGGWSAWRQFATLPAVAPGMTVVAAASGRSATITLTPPGGVSGVTKYTIERRVGTGAATTLTATSSPYSATGLTPGTSYQWRASAWIGTYQSPWTNWVTVAQPRPNTNPGDYFDGSTAAGADVVYSWTGTANNSTSVATSPIPRGWVRLGTGSNKVISRVTGGLFGNYAALITMLADAPGTEALASAGGGGAGIAYAPVVGDTTYTGSYYVQPSVATSLRACIRWYDAGGTLISTSYGSPMVVSPDGGWVRIAITDVAPSNAVGALLGPYGGDAAATILAGTTFLVDGAMISLGQLAPYIDGSLPATSEYSYSWLGTAHDSVSMRTEVEAGYVDPLADPDCPPVPLPPSLPTVDTACIDEVGMWRRYFVSIPGDQVRLWTSTLPTLVLTTGANAERQIRVRLYPNPDNLPVEQVDTDDWEAETIVTYVPPNTELTIDGVAQRAWAVVDGGDTIAADRLLYGTGGTPPTWPILRCGVGYLITLDTPLEAPAGNLSTDVYLTDLVI